MPGNIMAAIDRRHLIWVALPLVLAVVPHSRHLPAWIVGYFLALVALRFASLIRNIRLPGTFLRTVLTLTTLGAVYLSFGTLQGRSAGVGLLVALLGLKMLELKAVRDVYLVVFVGFFVIVTNFFFSESIPMVLYMLAISGLFIATLIGLNDPDHALDIRTQLRSAFALMAQAAPLMLVLFVLYPRIPGPLWGMPEDTFGERSGLSEQMSPGRISRLSQSNAVAFRVKFNGDPPPPKQRYWRGPVLWHTDGVTWDQGYRNEGEAPEISTGEQKFEYTITLEPHGKRWLFALDVPTNGPRNSYMTSDLRLLSRRPVTKRKRYELTSFTDFKVTELSERDLDIATRLPTGLHRTARGLAQQWRNDSHSDQEIIDRAMRYFRENPFYYTLTPPPLSGDQIDEFLFGTRRGFCEHYAAAFTVLMRAAGLPARVVTGYQGGEYNPLGEYLIVRQRDAHAWVEVWLAGKGWVRVDPTAAVAPGRVESGIDSALPLRGGEGLLSLSDNTTMGRLWLGLHRRWDAINNGWNQWILAYGPELQERLLIRAGLGGLDWREIGAGLVGLLLAGMIFAAWLLSRPSWDHDRYRMLFERFCRRLARKGIARRPSEGPRDFAERAAAQRPDLAAAIQHITALYLDLRYGRRTHTTGELAQAVRRFRT